jgi:hypothetical protein
LGQTVSQRGGFIPFPYKSDADMRHVSHRPGGCPDPRWPADFFPAAPIFGRARASLVVGFIRVAESNVVPTYEFRRDGQRPLLPGRELEYTCRYGLDSPDW